MEWLGVGVASVRLEKCAQLSGKPRKSPSGVKKKVLNTVRGRFSRPSNRGCRSRGLAACVAPPSRIEVILLGPNMPQQTACFNGDVVRTALACVDDLSTTDEPKFLAKCGATSQRTGCLRLILMQLSSASLENECPSSSLERAVKRACSKVDSSEILYRSPQSGRMARCTWGTIHYVYGAQGSRRPIHVYSCQPNCEPTVQINRAASVDILSRRSESTCDVFLGRALLQVLTVSELG